MKKKRGRRETLDSVWKAPVSAAEEFDRTMAQRIAAAATGREIPAESLDVYWRQFDDPAFEVDLEQIPSGLLDEFGWLVDGEACVRLADGSRWVVVSALMETDLHSGGPGDNAFLQRLHALLLEHKVLRSGHYGPGLPTVMLRADTLDIGRVFCTDCKPRCWVDLVADARKADQTLSPWEA